MKKQLHDYTAWVNNYLKRRPGAQLVTDLKASLQDGTTFVLLVEILGEGNREISAFGGCILKHESLLIPVYLGKVVIENIERNPTTTTARKGNTERACDFLRSDGVNLHSEAAKGFVLWGTYSLHG